MSHRGRAFAALARWLEQPEVTFQGAAHTKAPMLQEERLERSRTAILDAALELFSHRGYGATSMRDIAGKAGVSTGSVYHHFKDKESIFQALLEQFQAITQRPTSRSTWCSTRARSSTTSPCWPRPPAKCW